MKARAIVKAPLLTALLLPLAWPAVGNADGPRPRAADFIGLWAGVDIEDGSFYQRAITCVEDGTCEVLGSDQFFTSCDDLGGRGLLIGSGRLEDDVLHLPEFTLICGDGTEISFPTTYSIDRKNGTLVEVTDGPPASQNFHRLSPRVRSRR
jgi:hypothetical protein